MLQTWIPDSLGSYQPRFFKIIRFPFTILCFSFLPCQFTLDEPLIAFSHSYIQSHTNLCAVADPALFAHQHVFREARSIFRRQARGYRSPSRRPPGRYFSHQISPAEWQIWKARRRSWCDWPQQLGERSVFVHFRVVSRLWKWRGPIHNAWGDQTTRI